MRTRTHTEIWSESRMILYLALILAVLPSASSEWRRPVIRQNSKVVGESVVLRPGDALALRCEGDAPVTWQTRLAKHWSHISKGDGNVREFRVEHVAVEHTGTLKCVYINRTDLFSNVHLYVKDPKQLFLPMTSSVLRVVKKEGQSHLLPCLLTDPEASHLSLRMANGTTLPAGMTYTADPRRGVLLRDLLPGYNADYVCTARIHGVERTSRVFSLNIIQRLRFPPYVFLEKEKYVRIVGERLEIRCRTHNPNFNYNVTWKYSTTNVVPKVEEKVHSEGSQLDIESILSVQAVDMSHTGNVTCTGTNEAGVNSSSTFLQVVDKPYIRLMSQLPPRVTHHGLAIEVNEGEDLELMVLIEAYPEVLTHGWETPGQNVSTRDERFYWYNYRYQATLVLKRLNFQDQGQYTFFARSARANASITFQVQMYQKPVAVVRWENVTTLTCTSFGFPAPRILWYQCYGIRATCSENATGVGTPAPLPAQTVEVQREGYGVVEVESVLTVGPSDQRRTVECVAFNLAGVSSDTFPMEASNKAFVWMLCAAACLLTVLLVLMIVLIYKYKQKPRFEVRWKIIDPTNGNNYTFIDPNQLPYNEKWEFPRDKLKLGKVLGAGAFGKVLEATAYGLGEDKMRVAVKMLKASAHSDEKEALMSELKILSHLGQHKNIVNLLGACTHGGPVLVITEYCSHGDLLNFLRAKAESFLNSVVIIPDVRDNKGNYKNVIAEKTFIRSDSGISSACSDSYLDMKATVNTSQEPVCEEEDEEDSWTLDLDDLLRFSYQVAQGLDFLAAKNCIHRDVAARNVLLTNRHEAKICDFGLARDIMNDSNYVVKGNARLPVKWMAPESIFECVYTVQSDVWSYGILLWEIFSLGKSPYPGILVDSKFYNMIKSGYKMSRPDFALPEIYAIMKMCWNVEPTERPTFSKIGQLIQRLLGDQPDQLMYQNIEDKDQEKVQDEPLKSCDLPEPHDDVCEPTCDQEEEEQPLMKTNNYQFC